ncbi:MAG: ROK family protein [Rubripirellula sp.]
MPSDLYCGIDFGGTSVRAAIADVNGLILGQRATPTDADRGPEAVIETINTCVADLMRSFSVTELQGIGIGVPGLVDVKSGVTKFLPNLATQWRDVPIAQRLRERFSCRVNILNDARTATLGELRFGHGKGRAGLTMAFFSIGTGIGGGVVIDGSLRLGPLGAAGELGHQTIVADGPKCGCGNHGCLETLASGPAIAAEGLRLMRAGKAPNLAEQVAGDESKVTPQTMCTAAEFDPAIQDALVVAARHIGVGAANVVAILHPDLVVIGGGVSEIGNLLTDEVRTVIRQRVGMFPTNDVRVERSKLGDQAGLIGAVALATKANL